MIVTHWIQPYTLMMGVHTMDAVINVLCISGMVYAPFVVAIIRAIVRAMTEGEDEGNAGILAVKYLRKDLLIMIPVMVLGFVPGMDASASTSEMPAVSTCSSDTTTISPTTSTMIGSFRGGENRIPLWWGVVHNVSSVINNAVVASLPCPTDMRTIQVNINSAELPALYDQQLAKDWGTSCLKPAASSLAQKSDYNDKWWAGHQDFVNEYSKEANTVSISSDSIGLMGLSGVPAGNSVRVNCKVAYDYLQSKALAQLNQTNGADDQIEALGEVRTESKNTLREIVASTMFAEVKNPRQAYFNGPNGLVKLNTVESSTDNEDSTVAKIVARAGQIAANIMNAPDAIVYARAIPIQVCVIQMVALCVLPILLVFSGFDGSTALVLSGMYFGLIFTPAIVAIAHWVDSMIGVLMPVGDNVNNSMRDYAQGVGLQLYVLLPTAWMFLLGLIGVGRIGLDGLTNFGGSGQNAIKPAMMAMKGAAAIKSAGLSEL